jgi:hypothetical protein
MSEEAILLALQEEIAALKEQRKIDDAGYKDHMEASTKHKKDLYSMIEQSKQEQAKTTAFVEALRETQAELLEKIDRLHKDGNDLIELIAKQGEQLKNLTE